MRLSIVNGRVVDPARNLEIVAPVHVADGRIAAIGPAPAGFVAQQTLDARGLVVAPGFVDLAARLREPGFEYRATLESEMQAALAGGVTSLSCPPDTDPPLDEPGLVEMLKFRARNLPGPRVYPVGALTSGLQGSGITEMSELTEAGCVAFSQADAPLTDTQVLMRAMQYAQTYGYTVWLRPQDPHLGRGGTAHSGPLASRLGLAGVPVMSETIALHTIFELMRSTGARVHLCRLSSADGIALVRTAKAEGLRVSCDVGAHHVHLTDHDIGFFDPNARLSPPLRSQRDRDAIREALADGTIDAICSDHTPVDDDEKLLPFGEASPGATGLELLLSLSIKWAEDHLKGTESLAAAIARITCDPARVAGLDAGKLSVGSAADVCIFDPNARWKVEAAAIVSQGKHTPDGSSAPLGRNQLTVVGGRIRLDRRG